MVPSALRDIVPSFSTRPFNWSQAPRLVNSALASGPRYELPDYSDAWYPANVGHTGHFSVVGIANKQLCFKYLE